MSRYPLLPITIPFILGILVFQFAGATGWLFIIPACVGAGLFVTGHRLTGIVTLAAVTGYAVAMLRDPGPFPQEMAGPHLFSGVVREETERGAMRVMVVEIDSCDGMACRRFLAKSLVPTLGIEIGECDRVSFAAAMGALTRQIDLPDEIDYNGPLATRGVTGECYVVPDSVKGVAPEPGMVNDIRRMRTDVCSILSEGALSSGATDFLIATIAGERDMLTATHRDLFGGAGLAHILALSGLHVGVIAMLLSVVCFPVVILWRRWPACVITIGALWGFAVMTGLSPSVTRSVIMCSVFLVSVMLQREWSPVNALCLAALLILFFTPSALYAVGFQLSFIAVLSIIIFAERLNPFKARGSSQRFLMMTVTVPVAAMAGTGIVSAFHFHTFPVYFLVSNVLVSVFLPPLLAGGVVKVIIGAAGFCPLWLDRTLDGLYGAVERVASAVAGLPGASLDGIYIHPAVVVSYFVFLFFVASWLWRRRPARLIAAVIMLAFTLLLPSLIHESYPGSELYLTRSHSETTLVVRDGERLLTFTTAHPSQAPSVMDRDSTRYSRYMLRRGIRSMQQLADGYRSDVVVRNGNIVRYKGYNIHFITSMPGYSTHGLNYAVVCRGFRGDVVGLASKLSPDSVVLSGDLDLRRHDRYARELSEAGIAFRSLRDAPLVIR